MQYWIKIDWGREDRKGKERKGKERKGEEWRGEEVGIRTQHHSVIMHSSPLYQIEQMSISL